MTSSDLFAAVIADRRVALLSHGLAALDDATLGFLSERPELLTRLYERDAAAFAVFAGSLQAAIIVSAGLGRFSLGRRALPP